MAWGIRRMIETSAILKGNGLHIEEPFVEALDELVALCHRHLPSVDEDLIRRAFRLSYWAHRNDRRSSGEPYIIHPLAVARIYVEQIGFDDVSVAAALLHDVVEDTELSLEFISDTFGPSLATIIDGLTKISGAFESRDITKAENVRKLMLSMASDIRVIFVKFADRLHNMRTLDSLPPHKRYKIANETLTLFAPLAHRFGFFSIKSEFEDLSLKYIHPEEYAEITQGLRDAKRDRELYIERVIAPLKQRLEENGFEFEIYGRSKNLYSIFRKMKRQDKPLSEIYDIFAIRIVLKGPHSRGKEDCWRVYSLVTDLFKPLQERFRDFLSVPKSNGYQSLHTTVVGPEGRKVEIQIRTQEMHEIAEKGVAAHWKYKEGTVDNSDEKMDQFLYWVRELLENPESERATDFVKDFRLNLYDEEIYVFTPKGDLFTLPRGASPVDFAFLIHTEVGHHCIGAKVNGKMVPLSHGLTSGDQVEIITSKKQTPNPDWIKFVVTQKARSRIRNWVNEKRRKAEDTGRELWERKSKREHLELTEHELNQVANRLKYPSLKQLLYEVGSGLLDIDEMIKAARLVQRAEGEEPSEEKLRLQYENFLESAQSSGSPALLIDGEVQTDLATSYASCCNPIPGDAVFGFVSRTGTIKIHRVSCKNAPHLMLNRADRIVPVEWSRQKDVRFVSGLRVMGEDRVGMLNDVTTVISKNLKTNIRSLTISTEDGVFDGKIVLLVSDLDHLRRLIERIKRLDGVHGVYRIEEQYDDAQDA